MTLFAILTHMKLMDWRLRENLTLGAAATFFGLMNARTYQRYETGENRPDAPLAQTFVDLTSGDVSILDLHDTRLEWLRAQSQRRKSSESAFCRTEAAE